jgi:hypothetical protein
MGVSYERTTQPLSDYVSIWNNDVLSDPECTFISDKTGTYAGLSGYEIVYLSNSDGLELKEKAVLLVESGKAFVILFAAPPSTYDTYLTTFEQSLATLQISSTPPSSSKTISTPTVSLPAGWSLSESTAYPDFTPAEHDPMGSGHLKYVNTKYDVVRIYYEDNYGKYYSSDSLEEEAASLFTRDISYQVISDSGVATFAGVTAGYAVGYNSTSAFGAYKIVVFVKNDYYLSVYASYDADTQTENEITSFINGISVPVSGVPPSPTSSVTPTPSTSPTPKSSPSSSALTTTISCVVDSHLIEQGSAVTISGSISSVIGGIGPYPVTITIVGPEDFVTGISTNTDSSGAYCVQYVPSKPGQWRFQASWSGDSLFYGATSERATVAVEASSSPQWLPYIVVAVIAVVVLALCVFLVLRKRKKSNITAIPPQPPTPAATELGQPSNQPPPTANANTRAPTATFCPNCGKQNDPNAQFCVNCGASFNRKSGS